MGVKGKLPMLYVKCKTCGEEFASGISISEKLLDRAPLSNTLHRCSKGHEHQYNKPDYYYREETAIPAL
jgi:hypothetical protein